MSIPGSIPVTDSRPTTAGDLGRCALWVVWQCVRSPLFLFLLVLEPVVSFVLGAFALLGVLTALFWKFFGPPNFPFLLMLSISLGLELAWRPARGIAFVTLEKRIAEKLRLSQCIAPQVVFCLTCSQTSEITTEPSPTAEATRFTDPARTSPTAKMPG
jgi:hypothetical protein